MKGILKIFVGFLIIARLITVVFSIKNWGQNFMNRLDFCGFSEEKP